MNNTIKLSVDTKNEGKRLDIFLAENIDSYTRSFIKKLIDKCRDNQVGLLRTVGVIFSDDEKRDTQYIK